MRLLLATLVLCCSVLHCNAEEDLNYLYAITFTGGFATTRYATAEYANGLRKGRPDCIVVSWSYAPRVQGNDDELKPERDRADAAVTAELEVRPDAVAAATTLRGINSLWIIYATNGQDFGAGLERRLQQLTNSRVRVRVTRDAEWALLSNYVKSLREKQ
jgi:hypothetical protein